MLVWAIDPMSHKPLRQIAPMRAASSATTRNAAVEFSPAPPNADCLSANSA